MWLNYKEWSFFKKFFNKHDYLPFGGMFCNIPEENHIDLKIFEDFVNELSYRKTPLTLEELAYCIIPIKGIIKIHEGNVKPNSSSIKSQDHPFETC